jgi:hypothetical protein
MVTKTISYRKKSKKHLRKKSKKQIRKIKTKKIKFLGGVKLLKIEPQIKPQRASSRRRKSTSRYSPSSPNNRTITKRRQRFSKSKKDKPHLSLSHLPPSAVARVSYRSATVPTLRQLQKGRAEINPDEFDSEFDPLYGKLLRSSLHNNIHNRRSYATNKPHVPNEELSHRIQQLYYDTHGMWLF